MSKLKYIYKIQNTSFEFISKCFYNDRDFIKVKSIRDHEAKVFYVYSSKILFGLFKIHYDNEDEFLEDVDSFEDIVSNLLCFDLQRYIYDNIENIPVDINIKNEVKRYKNPKLTRNIFDGNRLQVFINHEDVMQENMYSEITSLIHVCKYFGIKNNVIDNIDLSNEDSIVINDSDKIELLKDARNKLISEFSNFNHNHDTVLFKYIKDYHDDDNIYLSMDINVKQRQISILNKKYNVIYLQYNLTNTTNDKKYVDLKYIVGIIDINSSIDEYGMYSLYYDNMYNKLNHFIYDDETYFDEKLLENIRIYPEDNILFVGNLSNFSFK